MTNQTAQLILTRIDELAASINAIGDRLDKLDMQPAVSAEPDFLTLKEAAKYLNVSERSVYRMKYLHVRRGKSIRIRRSSLDRLFRPDPLASNRSKKNKKN